jgi:hypothetical protein
MSVTESAASLLTAAKNTDARLDLLEAGVDNVEGVVARPDDGV